jgi:hypothetical protein
MKTRPIKINKRNFALLFNFAALSRMEEEIEGFDLTKIVEFVKGTKYLPRIIEILAREGEKEEGRVLDVDAEWFASHMSPNYKAIMTYQITVNNTMADGLLMETEDGEEAETDVVLDEIKKKEATGASPSGS